MEILSGDQMRNVDRRAIESMGISSLLLMESAGSGIAQAMLSDYPDLASRKVVVICGKGNNGGDGFVVARHLVRHGVDTRVVLLTRPEKLSGDPVVTHRAATASGVELIESVSITPCQISVLGIAGAIALDTIASVDQRADPLLQPFRFERSTGGGNESDGVTSLESGWLHACVDGS